MLPRYDRSVIVRCTGCQTFVSNPPTHRFSMLTKVLRVNHHGEDVHLPLFILCEKSHTFLHDLDESESRFIL